MSTRSKFVKFLWTKESEDHSWSCLQFQKGLCASGCCSQKRDEFSVANRPKGLGGQQPQGQLCRQESRSPVLAIDHLVVPSMLHEVNLYQT